MLQIAASFPHDLCRGKHCDRRRHATNMMYMEDASGAGTNASEVTIKVRHCTFQVLLKRGPARLSFAIKRARYARNEDLYIYTNKHTSSEAG